MICTTLQNRKGQELIDAISGYEMVEIRIDRCILSDKELEECFISDVPTVATCRISELLAANPLMTATTAALACEKRLVKAIVAGARYVDVEMEAPKSMVKRVAMAAKENGSTLIRSYHDYRGTGSYSELASIVEKCQYHGGEIVKIVTTATSDADVERVMRLYDEFDASGLIAFCMGEAGRESRLECLRRGAPFTYAAMDSNNIAAPGQWTIDEMAHAVYGDRRFFGFECAEDSIFKPLDRVLEMPSSKSFAQRAIIAAALCDGESRLHRYSECGDNNSAIALAKDLGAEISLDNDTLIVKGAGIDAVRKVFERMHKLSVGESGLLTRLMIPLVSVLSNDSVVLNGEKTLLDRVLVGVDDIMSEFGVSVSPVSGTECRVPLEVTGNLDSGRKEFSGKNGSQIISGLLMALPLLEKNSSFLVHDPVSLPYMFITVDILKKFGIKITDELMGGNDFMLSEGNWDFCSDILFKTKGGQEYRPAEFELEGDWSTAANFLVAGALFGRVVVSGLDTASLQADLSIMDILMDAGASISQYDGDLGDIAVQRSPLRAFTIAAKDCPDLFPIVSVLAAFCQGTTVIKGVGRLTHKESDRGKSIVEMLTNMGVDAVIEDDSLKINGMTLVQRILTGKLLKGGSYSSHHDHRMAMALSVASLGADSPVIIDDVECVAKSCPAFFKLMESFKVALNQVK